MRWSRRDVLKLGIGAWIFGRADLLRATRPESRRRPRYYVFLYLGGGVDALLSTDPKTPSEVEPWVELPYRPQDVFEVGRNHFAPNLAPLKPHLGDVSIVNAVRMRTVSHQNGSLQISRLRTGVTFDTPSIVDIIGSYRDGQPLAGISLGQLDEFDYSPDWFGAPTELKPGASTRSLFDQIDLASPADLEQMEAVLRDQALALRRGGKTAQLAAQHAAQSAALFHRLRSVPPFRPEVWAQNAQAQWYALNLQRALWAIEHDLTSCVYVKSSRLEWDSHSYNTPHQATSARLLFPLVSRFFDELKKRSNAHGPLAETTFLYASSEVGRHPRTNSSKGKDHFPEAPVLLAGPGVPKGVVFGRTGRQTESMKISPKTGIPSGPGDISVTLDDIGATVMQIAGIAPSLYGFNGTPLPFLLDA